MHMGGEDVTKLNWIKRKNKKNLLSMKEKKNQNGKKASRWKNHCISQYTFSRFAMYVSMDNGNNIFHFCTAKKSRQYSCIQLVNFCYACVCLCVNFFLSIYYSYNIHLSFHLFLSFGKKWMLYICLSVCVFVDFWSKSWFYPKKREKEKEIEKKIKKKKKMLGRKA